MVSEFKTKKDRLNPSLHTTIYLGNDAL
jgi:hypothetical protein